MDAKSVRDDHLRKSNASVIDPGFRLTWEFSRLFWNGPGIVLMVARRALPKGPGSGNSRNPESACASQV
jgi:hypothetical protein